MRKYNFLYLLITLYFCSCEPDPSASTKYIIQNNSTHNVEMFISNFAKFIGAYTDTTFNISSQDEISYYYSSYSEYPFPFGAAADSVNITFDDTISVAYVRADMGSRNPLFIENYTGGKVNDSKYEYYYTITEEDYENALANY